MLQVVSLFTTAVLGQCTTHTMTTVGCYEWDLSTMPAVTFTVNDTWYGTIIKEQTIFYNYYYLLLPDIIFLHTWTAMDGVPGGLLLGRSRISLQHLAGMPTFQTAKLVLVLHLPLSINLWVEVDNKVALALDAFHVTAGLRI